jgi:predicted acyltransferase (DUF342 family)
MLNTRKLASLSAGLLSLLIIAPAYAANMNRSITIGDGMETDGHSTVNGSISVGADCTIDGSLDTVNGTIRVDENTSVKDVETVNGSIRLASGVSTKDVGSVNGSIRLAERVTVAGEVTVVNGKISLGKGTKVAHEVSNINGEITLEGADVAHDLSTVNGDITLSDGAIVRGDIIVEKPGGWNNSKNREPIIIIGPGSSVHGTIVLERKVELFISDSAEVGGVSGEMSMDDAVRFSGSRP